MRSNARHMRFPYFGLLWKETENPRNPNFLLSPGNPNGIFRVALRLSTSGQQTSGARVWRCLKQIIEVRFIELDDGKIYRKALYLMVKTMVSCRFSLKPIQWQMRSDLLLSDDFKPGWHSPRNFRDSGGRAEMGWVFSTWFFAAVQVWDRFLAPKKKKKVSWLENPGKIRG